MNRASSNLFCTSTTHKAHGLANDLVGKTKRTHPPNPPHPPYNLAGFIDFRVCFALFCSSMLTIALLGGNHDERCSSSMSDRFGRSQKGGRMLQTGSGGEAKEQRKPKRRVASMKSIVVLVMVMMMVVVVAACEGCSQSKRKQVSPETCRPGESFMGQSGCPQNESQHHHPPLDVMLTQQPKRGT